MKNFLPKFFSMEFLQSKMCFSKMGSHVHLHLHFFKFYHNLYRLMLTMTSTCEMHLIDIF